MSLRLAACAAALASLPGAAFAQGMVSAGDPAGMAQVLTGAGYAVESDIDDYGDPLLLTDFGDYSGQIVFYGCDEASHDGCTSVQFTVGLDRAEPMPLEMVNALLASERFVSINLDEEGDPWITWDVVTLDGIPAEVFVSAIGQFSEQVGVVADKVFEAESGV